MGKEYTNSVLLVRTVLHAAQQTGLDPQVLCGNVGLDPTLLKDDEARIPTQLNTQLLLEAARLSGDDYWGLQIGEYLDPDEGNVPWFIFLSQPTLGEAVETTSTYYRLLSDISFPKVVYTDEEVHVVMASRVPGWNWHRLDAEANLSGWFNAFRRFAGEAVKIKRVELRHPQPPGHERLEAYFQAPVLFEKAEHTLVFSREIFDLPNFGKNFDPNLSRFLEKHGKAWLADLEPETSLVDKVRRTIYDHLTSQKPTVEWVANQVKITPRTLQRHLAEEGFTFRSLVDEVRQQLAKNYLLNTHLQIHDVCFLLGFSDQNSFYTACRRWFGAAPSEVRARSLSS